MANKSGNAYGLTALIPIQHGIDVNCSYASRARKILQNWETEDGSPMAKVPNTYLCRFYMLNDVFYQGSPAEEEHLQSNYLVFSSNFYGELEPYLVGMWTHAKSEIQDLMKFCVAFAGVSNGQQFYQYIKRCQVNNALFYNGSTDDSLEEQLKAIYLKQAFSHFIYTYMPKVQSGEMTNAQLKQAFEAFVTFTKPQNSQQPSWAPGRACEPDDLKKNIAELYQP